MEIIKARFLHVSGIVVAGLTCLALKVGNTIPSFIYPLFFAAFCFIYTKWLWKLVTPQLNVDADWWGYTEYQVLERKAGNDVPHLPIKKLHFIAFRQNPFELTIKASEGKDMVVWWADAITLYSEGRIVMAYSVKRKSNNKGFPPETKGYEEMHVVKRNWLGNPTQLKGVFFHAAEPGKNLFSGETEYYRGKAPKNIEKKIKKA